jgi:hypothetical protein
VHVTMASISLLWQGLRPTSLTISRVESGATGPHWWPRATVGVAFRTAAGGKLFTRGAAIGCSEEPSVCDNWMRLAENCVESWGDHE